MSADNIVVGFIGLGTMGGRMATNLQKSGFRLVVHDLHRQAASHHLNAGATWAETPRALASQADVIFTSLPEPSDVEAVSLGPDGLLAGIKPGAALFLDLSTNAPAVVKKLERCHVRREGAGAQMLDAPVSGGPAGAAFAQACRSGSAATKPLRSKARNKAVLDAMGDKVAFDRPRAAAPLVAKLVHNMSGWHAVVCALAGKRSRSASRPASSRWRYGRRCARARPAGASPSTR